MNQPTTIDELKEQLAKIEHIRWADWQRYLHSKLEAGSDAEGNVVMFIPTGLLNHWERQISTPYAELSEAEKQSDRDEVERYFSLIDAYYQRLYDERERQARIDELKRLRNALTGDGIHNGDAMDYSFERVKELQQAWKESEG